MIIKSWSWLAVAVIVFFLLGPALIWFAVNLMRGNRSDILTSIPLAHTQEINLPATGEVIVLVETPRMATDYGNFQIELVEKQTGRREVMKYTYSQAQGMVHGASTLKVPFGRMAAVNPGVYTVQITGLDPAKNYVDYQVLISRSYLARMAFQIIGIVFCAVGMLGCIIWAVWLAGLMKQGHPPDTGAGVPGHTIDLETWKQQQQNPPK